MLKITSRNETLNRRMARKEITYLLYKLFNCFFVSPEKLKKRKNSILSKTRSSAPIGRKKKNRFFSKRQISMFQLKRYSLEWSSKLSFRSPFTKAYSICFLTGRSRSVYRAFRLSRLKIRQFAGTGYFIGLAKASW